MLLIHKQFQSVNKKFSFLFIFPSSWLYFEPCFSNQQIFQSTTSLSNTLVWSIETISWWENTSCRLPIDGECRNIYTLQWHLACVCVCVWPHTVGYMWSVKGHWGAAAPLHRSRWPPATTNVMSSLCWLSLLGSAWRRWPWGACVRGFVLSAAWGISRSDCSLRICEELTLTEATEKWCNQPKTKSSKSDAPDCWFIVKDNKLTPLGNNWDRDGVNVHLQLRLTDFGPAALWAKCWVFQTSCIQDNKLQTCGLCFRLLGTHDLLLFTVSLSLRLSVTTPELTSSSR